MPELGSAIFRIKTDSTDFDRKLDEAEAKANAAAGSIAASYTDVDNAASGAGKSIEDTNGQLKLFGDTASRTKGSMKGLGDEVDNTGQKTDKLKQKVLDANKAVEALGGSATKLGRLRAAMSQIEQDITSKKEMNVDTTTAESKLKRLSGSYKSAADEFAKKELEKGMKDLGLAAGDLETKLGGGGGGKGLIGSISGLAGGLPTLAKVAVAGAPAVAALGGSLSALVGSLGAATVGAGAVGAGVLGTFGVGLGSIVAVAKPAADNVKKLSASYEQLKMAVQQYGANSTQAANAQAKFNALSKEAGPQAAKTAVQLVDLGEKWQEASKAAQNSLLGIVHDALGVAQHDMKSFADVAHTSADALRTGLVPVFDYLKSTDFTHSIKSLANEFKRISPDVGKSLADGMKAFGHVAVEVEPYVTKMFTDIRQEMDKMEAFTRSSKFPGFIHNVVGQLESWAHLMTALGRVLIDFFSHGAKQGQNLVDSLTQILDRWDRWMRSAQGSAQLTKFFNESVDALKNFMPLIAGSVDGFSKLAINLMPAMNDALKILNITILPLLNALTKIVGNTPGLQQLAAGFIAVGIATAGVKKTMGLMMIDVGNLRKGFGSLKTAITEAFAAQEAESFGGKLSGMLGMLGGKIPGAGMMGRLGGMGGMSGRMSGLMSNLPGNAMKGLGLGAGIGFGTQALGSIVGGHTGSMISGIGGGVATGAGIGMLVGPEGAAAGAAVGGLVATLKNVPGASAAASTAMKAVGNAMKDAAKWVGGAANDIAKFFTDIWNHSKTLRSIVGLAFSGIKDIFHGFIQAAKGVWEFVSGVFTGNWGKAWRGVKDIFSGIIKALIGELKVIYAPFLEISKKAIDIVVGEIKKLPRQVYDVFHTLVSGIISLGDDLAHAALKVGKDVVHGLVNGIKGLAGDAKNALLDVGKGALHGFTSMFGIGSPSKVMHDHGKNIVEGLRGGILGSDFSFFEKTIGKQLDSTESRMRDSTRAMAHDLTSAFNSMSHDAGQQMQALANAMSSTLTSVDKAVSTGFSFIGSAANDALKGLGAKPLSFKVDAPPHLAQGGVPHPGSGSRDDHLVISPQGVPVAAISGTEGIVNRPQMHVIDHALAVSSYVGAQPFSSLGELWGSGMTHYARGGDLVAEARADAKKYHIDPDIFERQIYAESDFSTTAHSGAGAVGIAQFEPGTAASMHIDPMNPHQALDAAARLDAQYIKQYGSWANALAAYNAGPGIVGHPLPAETQAYIAKILHGTTPSVAGVSTVQHIKTPRVTPADGPLGVMAHSALRAVTAGANHALDNAAPSGAGAPGGPSPVIGSASGPKGLSTFGGVTMATWIAEELAWGTRHGWHGQPTSGYRPGVDPHTATGTSEHQGTQYPHGAVDFGGYVDPAARRTKQALVDLAQKLHYPGPRLQMPVGFSDDGHLSGTGHAWGGLLRLASGGAIPRAAGGLPLNPNGTFSVATAPTSAQRKAASAPVPARHWNPFTNRYEMMTAAQYRQQVVIPWQAKYPKKSIPGGPTRAPAAASRSWHWDPYQNKRVQITAAQYKQLQDRWYHAHPSGAPMPSGPGAAAASPLAPYTPPFLAPQAPAIGGLGTRPTAFGPTPLGIEQAPAAGFTPQQDVVETGLTYHQSLGQLAPAPHTADLAGVPAAQLAPFQQQQTLYSKELASSQKTIKQLEGLAQQGKKLTATQQKQLKTAYDAANQAVSNLSQSRQGMQQLADQYGPLGQAKAQEAIAQVTGSFTDNLKALQKIDAIYKKRYDAAMKTGDTAKITAAANDYASAHQALTSATPTQDDANNMWLAMAQLTPNIQDDIKVLTKMDKDAKDAYDKAMKSGDPKAIAAAAQNYSSAHQALNAATPTQGDANNMWLAMAQLTPSINDDIKVLTTIDQQAKDAYDASFATGDPRQIAAAAQSYQQAHAALTQLQPTQEDWDNMHLAQAQLNNDQKGVIDALTSLVTDAQNNYNSALATDDPKQIAAAASALKQAQDNLKASGPGSVPTAITFTDQVPENILRGIVQPGQEGKPVTVQQYFTQQPADPYTWLRQSSIAARAAF